MLKSTLYTSLLAFALCASGCLSAPSEVKTEFAEAAPSNFSQNPSSDDED
jgi:hypothetical protein